MLGDGEVTRQQYTRQRERIEGKIDSVEQSPPPSSMNGEGREGHAGFKGFAIMAHRRLVSAVGGLAAQWPCLKTVIGVVVFRISAGRRLGFGLNARPLA